MSKPEARRVFIEYRLLETRQDDENAHSGGPGMEPKWGKAGAHERR